MASIILIALTLAVAGILGSWFTSLTKTETTRVEETTLKQVNCTSALIDIISVNCVNTSTDKKNWNLTILVSNIGEPDLYNFTVSAIIDGKVFYGSGVGPTASNPLKSGHQTILRYNCTICEENDTISKVTVIPYVCPAQAREEKTLTGVTCTAS